jgi:hypothetical protein
MMPSTSGINSISTQLPGIVPSDLSLSARGISYQEPLLKGDSNFSFSGNDNEIKNKI